jgi:hypothetical protein
MRIGCAKSSPKSNVHPSPFQLLPRRRQDTPSLRQTAPRDSTPLTASGSGNSRRLQIEGAVAQAALRSTHAVAEPHDERGEAGSCPRPWKLAQQTDPLAKPDR